MGISGFESEVVYYEPDQEDREEARGNLGSGTLASLNCTACDCQCACDCGSCYP